MTDDLKIRQKIAEEAQVSSATDASPAVRAFQFFLVPLLIVAGCVIVYAGFGVVMGTPRTAADWLEDIKSGGPSTRRHAALRMVQALRRQEKPDPGLVPKIIAVFEKTDTSEEALRAALASSLGFLRDPRGSDLLVETAKNDPSREVRVKCLDALGAIRDPETLSALVEFVDNKDPVVRKYAVFNLGSVASESKDPAAIAALKRKLDDPRADVTWNAALALAVFLEDGSGSGTLKMMLDREYLERTIGKDEFARDLARHAMLMACTAAVRLKDPSFVPVLENLAKIEPDGDVRHAAQQAAAQISRKRE